MNTAIESKYIITKENYEEFADSLAFTIARKANYSKECFGMSDLRLIAQLEHIMSEFIDLVIEAGYCPYALLNIILERHDLFIGEGSRRPDLKQTPDESMLINMSKFETILQYVDHCATVRK